MHVFVFSWTAAAVINGYTLQRSKQSIVHTALNMMAWIAISGCGPVRLVRLLAKLKTLQQRSTRTWLPKKSGRRTANDDVLDECSAARHCGP
jgi:hypothetical protein